MTTDINKTIQESVFDRVAREQFDAAEKRERVIRAEERAARAAQLKLPVQLVTRHRERKETLRLKGRS